MIIIFDKFIPEIYGNLIKHLLYRHNSFAEGTSNLA